MTSKIEKMHEEWDSFGKSFLAKAETIKSEKDRVNYLIKSANKLHQMETGMKKECERTGDKWYGFTFAKNPFLRKLMGW